MTKKEERDFLGKRLLELYAFYNTQSQDLADFIGVKRGRVLNWELGFWYPSQEQIKMIAKYFNVSEEFLTGKSKEFSAKEVEILIFTERKVIKNEIKSIKRELLDFLEQKYKDYYL